MVADEDTGPNPGEKLTDVSDIASAQEALANQAALAAHARKMRRDQEPDARGVFAVLVCDDCGLEIGELRLAVAIRNRLCVHCAAVRERR